MSPVSNVTGYLVIFLPRLLPTLAGGQEARVAAGSRAPHTGGTAAAQAARAVLVLLLLKGYELVCLA